MTLNEVIKAVGGITKLNSSEEIREIKTDTRKLKKGDLFIALKGKNYDGHDFIKEAIDKGAIACITENFDYEKCINVKDTYKSLFDLAKYIRSKYSIPLIAVTGSNGKTTTKDLIYHILDSQYKVLKNEGSNNNLIGVSDTLFKLDNTYDIIMMELGSNHIGEISYLSKMCLPTTSLITNIGSSHLEYFKTKKNIFKEKYSVKDGMINENIIVNGDDRYLKKIKCYKCGIKKRNDLIAYDIEDNMDNISFKIYLDKEYKIVFNNPGVHFVNDILLAIKVCLDYGVKIKTIIKKINNFKITDKRMKIIKVNDNIIINDCYNSSLESITAGINYIKKINSDKVLIIGDILELGKKSKKIHKKIKKKVSKLNNVKVLTVGKYSSVIKGVNFSNSDELIDYIDKNPITNSYIYIKGSRRMNLDKIVNYFKS